MVHILCMMLIGLAWSQTFVLTPKIGTPMQCKTSTKTVSSEAGFSKYENLLPDTKSVYIWNGEKSKDTCVFSGMTMEIAEGAKVYGVFLADGDATLYVNGSPAMVYKRNGKKVEEDVTQYFPTPGQYDITVKVDSNNIPFGMSFILSETFPCDSSCLTCSPSSCSKCNIDAAAIKGTKC